MMTMMFGRLAGCAAAGIAAAFNTPLAGLVFAIEEMARAYPLDPPLEVEAGVGRDWREATCIGPG